MALTQKPARGAVRNFSRTREKPKPAPSANRNRRSISRTPGKPLSISFTGVGKMFSWLGAVGLGFAVAGFLTVGLLYGYRYLTNSPYFAVKNLEIVGNFRLSSREVLDAAGLREGMNSLLVSIGEVERKLAANPWIGEVSVRRFLPDGFAIRMTEREPHFWVRHGGVLYYADARGGLIVPVSAEMFASFPTLEVEAGAEELTARLPELLASLAASKTTVDVKALSVVRLSPGRGVEVVLENESLVLSIGHEEWARNLERLAATLADVALRGEMREVREVRVHGARVWVIKKGPVT